MRRYFTDRFGLISSVDIADALRRARQRQREEGALRREREGRRARRWASLRGLLPFEPFDRGQPKPAH